MTPKNWIKIDKNEYKRADADYLNMHCTSAFTKNSFGKTITVIFYEMGDFQVDIFKKMIEHFEKVNGENYLIDGDPESPDFEDTSIISYLHYKEFKIGNHSALLNIAKVLVAENTYDIVCQINYENDGKLCNVQFAMPQFDKFNISESLQKDGTISEILEYLNF